MTQPSVSSLRDMMNAVEQSPDLQRELREWVLRLIRGSDDLRQELRREILTEELLQLPARFTRMEEDVGVLKDDMSAVKEGQARVEQDVAVLKDGQARIEDDVSAVKDRQARIEDDLSALKDGQARIEGDVSALKDGQARLEQDVADLRRGQAQMSGHISDLRGRDYESRAVERSRRLIRRLHGMERATLIHVSNPPSPTFDAEILIPAIRSGRITRDEADDLEDADCILRLEDPEKETIYAVVEISITVQETDRVRAARRAELFSRAVGVEALAYVVGQQEEPPGDALARVTFVECPPES